MLSQSGFPVYTEDINQELFDLLESIYDDVCEINDIDVLKKIYS